MIVNADCLEHMKKMEDESVDLVVTSPPYNLRNTTGNYFKDTRGSKWVGSEISKGYDNTEDNMPHDEYVRWQMDCLTEMMRLIPDTGAIFYIHKWRVQGGLLQDRSDIVAGFPVRQIIIWQRAGGINFNNSFFVPTYEVIYMIAKPKFKLKPTMNKFGDVWKITQENNNPHPAPFPVELAERIIMSTDAKVVLDSFMGSGTTGVAAMKHDRKFIGIEKSKKYCEMAEARIAKVEGQGRLFEY